MANKQLDSSPRSNSIDMTPFNMPRVVISNKPRDFGGRLANNDLLGLRNMNQQHNVVVDMTSINKARLQQLYEPFKAASERIEVEKKNLESLKIKKSKLRNKLIDVYHFLLKNPQMIM